MGTLLVFSYPLFGLFRPLRVGAASPSSFVWSFLMVRFACLSYLFLVLFLVWASSQPVVPCSVDPGSGWCEAVSEPLG